MAKVTPKNDERKGRARYIDQKGQWQDTTPPSVKKRQDKDWKKLEDMLKKPAKKPTKKK